MSIASLRTIGWLGYLQGESDDHPDAVLATCICFEPTGCL